MAGSIIHSLNVFYYIDTFFLLLAFSMSLVVVVAVVVVVRGKKGSNPNRGMVINKRIQTRIIEDHLLLYIYLEGVTGTHTPASSGGLFFESDRCVSHDFQNFWVEHTTNQESSRHTPVLYSTHAYHISPKIKKILLLLLSLCRIEHSLFQASSRD